jgi:hypothetical protein
MLFEEGLPHLFNVCFGVVLLERSARLVFMKKCTLSGTKNPILMPV